MKKILLLFFISVILFQAASIQAALPYSPYDPARILITFDKSKADLITSKGRDDAKKMIESQKDWKLESTINSQNLAVVLIDPTPRHELDKDESNLAQKAIEKVNSLGWGKAQYNINYIKVFQPDDPEYLKQSEFFEELIFNGKEMGFLANEAWDKTEKKVYENKGGVYKGLVAKEVVVAIVDGGMRESDFQDKDLKDVIWKSKTGNCLDHNGLSIKCPYGGINIARYLKFGTSDQSYTQPISQELHGVVMARIIGGLIENGESGSGINNVDSKKDPYLKLMTVKAGETTGGWDNFFITSAQIIAGIHFARFNNADLINLSLEQYDEKNPLQDEAVVEAIKLAGNSGLFIVTPDAGLCSSKNPKIESQYYRTKEKFDPLICVNPYRLLSDFDNADGNLKDKIKQKESSGKKERIITLKEGDYLPLEILPVEEREFTHISLDNRVDILAPQEIDPFLFGNDKTEPPTMRKSIAAAYVTGAMAHLLRFGLVNKDNKALLRCITENASDNFMSLGYDRGQLYPTLNLKKMVNFSGDLKKCQDIEKSRKAISGVEVKIDKFFAVKTDQGYKVKAEFLAPKNVGSLEYIVSYRHGEKSMDYQEYFKIANVDDDNRMYFEINVDPNDFASDNHCLIVYARNPNSILVGSSKEYCAIGSELVNGKDAVSFDVIFDEEKINNVVETAKEEKIGLALSLSKSSSSGAKSGDLVIEINRENRCLAPETASQKAIGIIKRSMPKTQVFTFKQIQFDKDGKWKNNILVDLNPITPIIVTAKFTPSNGKMQESQKTLYLEYDLPNFYGAEAQQFYCFVLKKSAPESQIFSLKYEADIPWTRIKTKGGYLKITLPAFVSIEKNSYQKEDNNVKLISTESNDLWTTYLFSIDEKKHWSGKRTIKFSANIIIPQNVQQSLLNDLLIDVYDKSEFYFKNAVGKMIRYPLFFVLKKEDLDDPSSEDQELNQRITVNSFQPYSLQKTSQDKVKITLAIIDHNGINLQAIASLQGNETIKSGWFEVYAKSYPDARIRMLGKAVAGNISIGAKEFSISDGSRYCTQAFVINNLGATYKSDPFCLDGSQANNPQNVVF